MRSSSRSRRAGRGSTRSRQGKSPASVSSIRALLPACAVLVDAFRQELSKLGWIEGKNITIEYRFAEQKPERVPELAAEDWFVLRLISSWSQGDRRRSRPRAATTTIPIVIANDADPIGAGLVASLARPGGNVTGLSSLGVELATKRIEILKDAVPKLARVGVLRPAGG